MATLSIQADQFGGPLRLTQRGRLALVVLALLAFALVGFLRGGVAFGQSAPLPASHVIVERGDTLWSIARSLDPADDPRDTVQALRDANGLADDAALIPGQSLVVPASS